MAQLAILTLWIFSIIGWAFCGCMRAGESQKIFFVMIQIYFAAGLVVLALE